jgi:hypothetical protein
MRVVMRSMTSVVLCSLAGNRGRLVIAIAIANVQARAELTASRARIVAAADDTRRRIERDLLLTALNSGLSRWDSGCGWQKSSVQPEQMALREQICDVVTGLGNVSDELREISRGIHPVILSKGGLARSQWRRGVTG